MQARIGSAESGATYFPNANCWERGNPSSPGCGNTEFEEELVVAETSSLAQDVDDLVIDGDSLVFHKPTSKTCWHKVGALECTFCPLRMHFFSSPNFNKFQYTLQPLGCATALSNFIFLTTFTFHIGAMKHLFICQQYVDDGK